MIDAANGGALVDKTLEAARNLIANMAANSQKFGTRLDLPSKNVNQEMKQFQQKARASIQSLDNQMGQMAITISQVEVQNSRKLPSQTALAVSRKDGQNKDLYETFHRCEVNIPILYAIKQVPCYAKFLKELCTIKKKQKLKGCEKVRVGENVSTVIQRNLPMKCKDPSMFTIPFTLGNPGFEKAMKDLGASINVMPYSIHASLKLGHLNKIGVVIQLTDRSNAYPMGVVDGVLVQVNDLIFPTHLYVFDMENGDQSAPILLGRPFLKSSKTKIDVHSVTLTMEFDGEIVKSNIYDTMKYSDDDNHDYSIDVIDYFAQEVYELDGKDELDVAISKNLEKENEQLALSSDLQETVAELNDIPQLQ
ncbi:uncharacterized protein [Aristolochia californica]|uniref:uncharacterized protein n=1 Tax=Aristolochia californica TaxID=171875 RepID=UPI0035D97841